MGQEQEKERRERKEEETCRRIERERGRKFKTRKKVAALSRHVLNSVN
jgi:hypothetical protein